MKSYQVLFSLLFRQSRARAHLCQNLDALSYNKGSVSEIFSALFPLFSRSVSSIPAVKMKWSVLTLTALLVVIGSSEARRRNSRAKLRQGNVTDERQGKCRVKINSPSVTFYFYSFLTVQCGSVQEQSMHEHRNFDWVNKEPKWHLPHNRGVCQ